MFCTVLYCTGLYVTHTCIHFITGQLWIPSELVPYVFECLKYVLYSTSRTCIIEGPHECNHTWICDGRVHTEHMWSHRSTPKLRRLCASPQSKCANVSHNRHRIGTVFAVLIHTNSLIKYDSLMTNGILDTLAYPIYMSVYDIRCTFIYRVNSKDQVALRTSENLSPIGVYSLAIAT